MLRPAATSAAACSQPRDSAPPRLRLLGSPPAQALRSELGALVAWFVGVGAFALLMGVISDAATPDVISERVRASSRSSAPSRS